MNWRKLIKRLLFIPEPKLPYTGYFREVCRFCGDVIELNKGFGKMPFCSKECLDYYQGRRFTMLNGFKVKEIRIAKGMTQRELSIAAGMDSSQISKIERFGPQDLMLSTAEKIAKSLGVQLRDILSQDGD